MRGNGAGPHESAQPPRDRGRIHLHHDRDRLAGDRGLDGQGGVADEVAAVADRERGIGHRFGVGGAPELRVADRRCPDRRCDGDGSLAERGIFGSELRDNAVAVEAGEVHGADLHARDHLVRVGLREPVCGADREQEDEDHRGPEREHEASGAETTPGSLGHGYCPGILRLRLCLRLRAQGGDRGRVGRRQIDGQLGQRFLHRVAQGGVTVRRLDRGGHEIGKRTGRFRSRGGGHIQRRDFDRLFDCVRLLRAQRIGLTRRHSLSPNRLQGPTANFPPGHRSPLCSGRSS